MAKALKISIRICKLCGIFFKPTGNRQLYCPICRRKAIRGYKKKYKKTKKGKESEYRYRHSKKGIAYVWRQNQRESIKDLKRIYNKSEAGRASRARYRNTDKYKAYRKKAISSEAYKTAQRVRHIFKNLLKRKNKDKVHPLLGYTPRQAIEHIQSLFIPGMFFENTKTWCIHHIKPISMFTGDVNTIIREANALSNIIVLTPEEHMELHGKLTTYGNTADYIMVLESIIKRRKNI